MATTRAILLQDQPIKGGVEEKNGGGEKRNRKALGDIGNLVTNRGGRVSVNNNGIAKPQPVNRPLTRSFCAQLLANAQTNVDKNKKQGEQVVNVDMGAYGKVEAKPLASQNNKSPTLTSFLTARSKEACGLTKKPEELIMNIDEGSKEDELAVVEYVDDIYNYYKIAENESRLKNYMSSQPEINEKMRSILVDWLIEVHYKFELRQETLYLTINIIDRFLSIKIVPRKELQLVGIAAMLIACKYEEIWAPEVDDFVQISDKAYVREQVLGMEKAILGKLVWYLTVPTPYMFLTRYIKASIPSDSEIENMVYFFAELGIVNYSTTIKYPPSQLAAASVYTARCTLNYNPSWTETLRHYTGYSENQLKECARLLVSLHMEASESRLRAVFNKFSKPDNGAVALRSPAKTWRFL